MKTLEEFDFTQARRFRRLGFGSWPKAATWSAVNRSCQLAKPERGQSHLATGLCVAACRQKRGVRFTTAAALVNELVEAKQNNQVRRPMIRWQKYELIALDEVGYVPLADHRRRLRF
jgi:DNA replication protein DnaC